jgi:hypothetical protein
MRLQHVPAPVPSDVPQRLRNALRAILLANGWTTVPAKARVDAYKDPDGSATDYFTLQGPSSVTQGWLRLYDDADKSVYVATLKPQNTLGKAYRGAY